MKFLSKLKIGQRLRVVFGLIILLSLINLIYNLVNLNSSKVSVDIMKKTVSGVDNLIEADRDAYQSSLAISLCIQKEVYDNPEKLKYYIQEIRKNRDQIGERFEVFSTTFDFKGNKDYEQMAHKFTDNYTKVSGITDSIVHYLNHSQVESAHALYLTVYPAYFDAMRSALNDFTDIYLAHSDAVYQNNLGLLQGIKINSLVIFLLILGVFIVSGYALKNSISKPLAQLKEVISNLSLGKISSIHIQGEDEISEMAFYIEKLTQGLDQTASFASEIGKGNLSANFTPLSNDDKLGHSLKNMQQNLARVAEEDSQRNWANSGVASLGEILRNHNTQQEEIYNATLTFVIKYLNACQGGIFILNDNDENKFLELSACYAFNRNKFLDKKINVGEGLVGQAVLEKDIIYMTDVPANYLKITSGMGEAPPRNILIVPLKNNEAILGVIELASFQKLRDFEIDFVKRISESIAAAISSIKINEKTKTLLEHSQKITEELKEQEEEMRQNMEELQATQEESQRREEKLLQEIEELKQKIEQA